MTIQNDKIDDLIKRLRYSTPFKVTYSIRSVDLTFFRFLYVPPEMKTLFRDQHHCYIFDRGLAMTMLWENRYLYR